MILLFNALGKTEFVKRSFVFEKMPDIQKRFVYLQVIKLRILKPFDAIDSIDSLKLAKKYQTRLIKKIVSV